jgi:putative glycosyltransferase (TIGR04372 family)
LVVEPECYLRVNQLEERRVRPVFLVEKGKVGNHYVLRLWKRLHPFVQIPSGLYAHLWDYATRSSTSCVKPVYGDYQRYSRAWSRAWDQPLLSIPPADRRRGEDLLRQLGIPEGAWFVCVHVREAGYLPGLSYHSYRDCAIDAFYPAMEYIASQGGYVIRMGDPSMGPIRPMKSVIDYAHSRSHCDFLDIYLCAFCRFFLGTNSGLVSVPAQFKRPLAEVNMIPFQYAQPGSLFIPKLIYSRNESRCLTFEEVLRRGIHHYDSAQAYALNGFDVVDNEPEDILALVQEQISVLQDSAVYTPDDERMRNSFSRFIAPLGLSRERVAHVGRDFMRKHKEMLVPGEDALCLHAGKQTG